MDVGLAVVNSVALGTAISLVATIVLGDDFKFCATLAFHFGSLSLLNLTL